MHRYMGPGQIRLYPLSSKNFPEIMNTNVIEGIENVLHMYVQELSSLQARQVYLGQNFFIS